jgi:hypothetical protein
VAVAVVVAVGPLVVHQEALLMVEVLVELTREVLQTVQREHQILVVAVAVLTQTVVQAVELVVQAVLALLF